MLDREDGRKQLNVRVPIDLHRKLKVLAAEGGTSLQALMEKSLEAAAKQLGRREPGAPA